MEGTVEVAKGIETVAEVEVVNKPDPVGDALHSK
jgi:hypothetical protein